VKTKRSTLRLLAVVFMVGPFFALRASAEDTPASAPEAGAVAAVDADGGADAGEDADAGKPLPAFDEKPFPEEKSPRPKDAEWKDAEQVALSPRSWVMFDSRCKAQRIREWMRLRCGETTGQITMLGGNDPQDVSIQLDLIKEEWQTFPDGAELIFSVRKGDCRIFEWLGVEFGYRGASTATSFLVISEEWLPWEEKPTIFAQ
jgi:hypothetical protein